MTTRASSGRKGIPLRAHHLLCFLGFQGIGYTADFIRNFHKVKRLVEQNPDLEIEVVDTCDVVCISAPTRKVSTVTKVALTKTGMSKKWTGG
jgi:hypothetical protein